MSFHFFSFLIFVLLNRTYIFEFFIHSNQVETLQVAQHKAQQRLPSLQV